MSLNDTNAKWFPLTNSGAPSGFRAINTHLINASICPLLYCDENGTIFIAYDFCAAQPLPQTLTTLQVYYINNANNIQVINYVSDATYGGTVRIKITYKQFLCRGVWFSLNGRARFITQTFAQM